MDRHRLSARYHHPDCQRRTAWRHDWPQKAAVDRHFIVLAGLALVRSGAYAGAADHGTCAAGPWRSHHDGPRYGLRRRDGTERKTGSAIGLLGTMSAIATALGPSLGGVLIAGLSWRAIFLINLPLGALALVLAHRYLPVDQRKPKTERASFDTIGTLLLALTLTAYALAMTVGRGSFGPLNMALLLAAFVGAGLCICRSENPITLDPNGDVSET